MICFPTCAPSAGVEFDHGSVNLLLFLVFCIVNIDAHSLPILSLGKETYLTPTETEVGFVH